MLSKRQLYDQNDAPSEQRKDSTKKTTHQSIRSDGTGREHQIRLDEIVQQVQKDRQDAKARGEAGERRRDPMDVLSETGPREPEDPNGEADAADHGGWKSPFRDGHVVVRGQFAVVTGRDRDHEDGAEELACDVRLEGTL